MIKINQSENIKNTIKLQPIIILYSMVSIGSKIASTQIPQWKNSFLYFLNDCITNLKLIGILFAMIAILFVYAVIWQKAIKNVPITIMYANKSTYIFWTQLAAVFIFHEEISMSNILGMVIIFFGIMVVNSNE